MFIYSRGRTQVEAGTRTVLGIGPGRSPVVSDEVVPLINLLVLAQHRSSWSTK